MGDRIEVSRSDDGTLTWRFVCGVTEQTVCVGVHGGRTPMDVNAELLRVFGGATVATDMAGRVTSVRRANAPALEVLWPKEVLPPVPRLSGDGWTLDMPAAHESWR